MYDILKRKGDNLIMEFLKYRNLINIEKPSRYMGNELNSIKKDLNSIEIRFGFCFPDTYEIGMSHLGMKILYHVLNERVDTYCERFFAPWPDMEKLMRENKQEIFSLETKNTLKDFDIIGFTLQYEMSYTNILNMLDLGNIPIKSKDRGDDFPIVCAGGPCAYNPEVLAPFVDFFLLGEAEEAINEVLDVYKNVKQSGGIKIDILNQLAKIEGIYVPAFYNIEYTDVGTINKISVNNKNAKLKVKKRIIKDLDKVAYPDKFVVPYTSIVHDRIVLEIFRGCKRGCRFCQAGFVYRPVREKSIKTINDCAQKLINSTGYDEMTLSSLSTSDYSNLEGLTNTLIKNTQERKVGLSFPSLRVDSFSLSLMDKVLEGRKSGLTFAPEAGTQRLRDVINKGVTEEDIIKSLEIAFSGGWSNVKLYFMIGLPTETYEDLDGIAELALKIIEIYKTTPKEKRGKGLNITISVSSFVPKAFTPFQWERQDDLETLREKQNYLRDKLKCKYIRYIWHDNKTSSIEGVIARGDRSIADVIYRAWELGCKFDSWGEHFKFELWKKAFEDLEINPNKYSTRKRSYEEVLPWDHIDIGVDKDFLIKENQCAYNESVTKNCIDSCADCGIQKSWGGICFEECKNEI